MFTEEDFPLVEDGDVKVQTVAMANAKLEELLAAKDVEHAQALLAQAQQALVDQAAVLTTVYGIPNSGKGWFPDEINGWTHTAKLAFVTEDLTRNHAHEPNFVLDQDGYKIYDRPYVCRICALHLNPDWTPVG